MTTRKLRDIALLMVTEQIETIGEGRLLKLFLKEKSRSLNIPLSEMHEFAKEIFDRKLAKEVKIMEAGGPPPKGVYILKPRKKVRNDNKKKSKSSKR